MKIPKGHLSIPFNELPAFAALPSSRNSSHQRRIRLQMESTAAFTDSMSPAKTLMIVSPSIS